MTWGEKTKVELYDYYKSSEKFNKAGYLSPVYGKTYYDGYGYNYYNGNYGYYEYSRPPLSGVGPPWEIGSFFTMFGTFIAIIAAFVIAYLVNDRRQQSHHHHHK